MDSTKGNDSMSHEFPNGFPSHRMNSFICPMHEIDCIVSNPTELENKVCKTMNSQGPQVQPALIPHHCPHLKLDFGRFKHGK